MGCPAMATRLPSRATRPCQRVLADHPAMPARPCGPPGHAGASLRTTGPRSGPVLRGPPAPLTGPVQALVRDPDHATRAGPRTTHPCRTRTARRRAPCHGTCRWPARARAVADPPTAGGPGPRGADRFPRSPGPPPPVAGFRRPPIRGPRILRFAIPTVRRPPGPRPAPARRHRRSLRHLPRRP